MRLWRAYLEKYAEHEGDVACQIVVASHHAAEVLGFLSRELDREGRYQNIIEERIGYFRAGSRVAEVFEDKLINATFTLYNHINTLGHQLADGNREAEGLIRQIDEQVRLKTQALDQMERSVAALRAVFPLLSLMTLASDRDQVVTQTIRQIEQRFAAGSKLATTSLEHLLNALYRIVEMMQLFVTLSASELSDQVLQIADRFQEEDQSTEMGLKLRNGFCRLFELAHLLASHLDTTL